MLLPGVDPADAPLAKKLIGQRLIVTEVIV